MSLMGDITDFITGGANKNAQGDLQNILNQIEAIQTPTEAQLQLGPLAQYQMRGELIPALLQAAQAGPSAYTQEQISAVPMSTMQQALAQETAIANAKGMTPQEQAAIAQAEEAVNTNLAGQRGAISQDFAQRGVPQSLISAALQNATAGQGAQQEYENALQAQGQAAGQGITALQNEGALAGQMYAQQAGQENAVAAAQNALNQFNAANTQQAGLANQANTQAANTYNTTTKQNLANQNTSGAIQRQIQNEVEAPQEAAQLALQRANALMGIGEAQAGQQTGVGQQAAGLFSGFLGAGADLGSSAMNQAYTPGGIPTGKAAGGEIDPRPRMPAANFIRGGQVDGVAKVAGDDERNDTVPAKLSPGEFVVPRTAMARPEIRNFLAKNVPTPRPPSAHPSDVASILKALSMLRAGAGA